MIDCGSVEYAYARVHARHGRRLDTGAWRRIETLRDFAPMLELARAGSLSAWLDGIGERSDSHRIETVLRRHWHTSVDEVASWLSAAWQPAVRWWAWLPELPMLQHLARGSEPPPWMCDDEIWRDACALPAAERAGWLASSPASALLSALRAPDRVGELWLAEWRQRLPRTGSDDAAALDTLLRVLLEHREAFVRAALGQGHALRARLQSRLEGLLQRLPPQPAVVFVHLALMALDLERLRAELLRRRLFPRWGTA